MINRLLVHVRHNRFIPTHGLTNRYMAVGDAAVSFDPLSAQGIQKSLETGIACAQAIVDQLKHKQLLTKESYGRAVLADFASYQSWHKYYYGQEHRWPDLPFWRRRQRDSIS